MTNQIDTDKDIQVFVENYKDARPELYVPMCIRLRELHQIYDKIQQNASHVLTGDDSEARYDAFKYIAGMAVAMGMQEDEVIEDFIKYGSNNGKQGSAFWSMVEFERLLKKASKSFSNLTEKERHSLYCRMKHYSKSNAEIKEASMPKGRIGTSVLYPMMAIMHNIKYGDKTDDTFKNLVLSYIRNGADIDTSSSDSFIKSLKEYVFSEAANIDIINEGIVAPIFDDPDVKKEKEHKQKSGKSKSTKQKAKKQQSNDEPTEEIENDVTSEIVSKIEDKKFVEKLLENKELILSKEFIKFAKDKFMSEQNFDSVELDGFVLTVIKKIDGQVCGETQESPFKNASNADEVKAIYGGLGVDLQNIFIKKVYVKRAVESLVSDVLNYKELSKEKKVEIVGLCAYSEELDAKVKEQKQDTQKQRSKAIRRLYRLSNKYSDDKAIVM